MTLRSERGRTNRSIEGAAPPRLLTERELKGPKTVSRLEFRPFDQPVVDEIALTENSSQSRDGESDLKRQVELLTEELKSQGQHESVRVELACVEARAQARLEWEEELRQRIAIERECVSRTLEQFCQARARYFAGVEAEVVKLSLAIAARVLHREAQLDPLMLTAVVRVALAKVADGSATVLRVPPNEVVLWRGVFGGSSLQSSVQVLGEEELSAGDCVLETNVGRVELGVSAQLREIETGFFDLLQRRPS